MCLYSNKMPETKRTESEQVYYKVLAVGRDGRYYTPYMLRPADLDVLHVQPDQEKFDVKKYPLKKSHRIARSWWEVTYGGFHLFTEQESAIDEANYLIKSKEEYGDFNNYVVVKAVVPEGTAYVDGEYSPGSGCVVVKKVKYEML